MARKLSGEISLLEMEELAVLLKENPDAHLKIEALTELWNHNHFISQTATEKDYEMLLSRHKENDIILQQTQEKINVAGELSTNKKITIRYISVAAVVVSLLAAGAFFWFRNTGRPDSSVAQKNTSNTISTKYGSRSTMIELPDGSTVWLNSGSKLTYDKQFGNTLREVHLTGEGFFDVVHNDEKPFIIHTAFFDIKDLGTQFNVKCYPDDKTTETSVIEGSVEVIIKKRPDQKQVLKKDQKLVLPNETITQVVAASVDEKKIPVKNKSLISVERLTYLPQDSFAVETAWRHNKLSFEDEAFSEVAKKMERWYAAEFEFRNRKQEDIHISGSFVSETIEQAMEALKYTNRFNYTIKEGKVIIY